jgi:urease accessory protein
MVEPMVAASVLVLGALLVLAARLPAGIALGLIVGAGALHGWRMGPRLRAIWRAYFAGFLASSALLHALGWQAGRTLFQLRGARLAAGLALGAAGIAPLAGLIGEGAMARTALKTRPDGEPLVYVYEGPCACGTGSTRRRS